LTKLEKIVNIWIKEEINMENNLLKVNFLGEFSLLYNDEIVLESYSKNNKVICLLQYLLFHRGKSFSKESLMELIYEDDEIENPENALKIIVHRLRRFLITIGLPKADYIENSDGKYRWNPNIPCEIDTEIFDMSLKMAYSKSLPDNKSLEFYLKAIDIYKGEFLERNYMQKWVVPSRVYFQKAYVKAFIKLFEILRENKDYSLMYSVADKGTAIYPYDEEILFIKIFALHAMEKTKEAIREYTLAVDIILDEFGVEPSIELVKLFSEISSATQNKTESVNDVKKQLNDMETDGGAYYCNFQNFADTYRFLTRGLERSGLSAFLMLCSITNKQGKAFENDKLLMEYSKHLKNATKDALRKGDLYTRYSVSQYLYLLVGINQENCRLVYERVENNFRKNIKNKPVTINYKVVSAADIDLF
jgi:DNA-binding SARP family transcriptional activator